MDDKALNIDAGHEGPVTVLSFMGDLDLANLQQAKERLQKELDAERTWILFDLDQVEYIDSSGLGFLIGTLKRVRERKGQLKLARLNAYMMGIFKLLNLHEVLEVYDDIDRALASFSSQPSEATDEA